MTQSRTVDTKHAGDGKRRRWTLLAVILVVCGLSRGGLALASHKVPSGGSPNVHVLLNKAMNAANANASSPLQASVGYADTSSPPPAGAYAWGAGDSGQLGDGSTADQPVPVPITTNTPPLAQLSSSEDFTVAIAVDGTAWSWGANDAGQLGNGASTTSDLPVPVTMPPGVKFTAVATGEGGCCRGHVMALDTTGEAWAWGSNAFGSNGTGSASNVPLRVIMPAGVTFEAVGAGPDQSYAVGSDGTPYGWGDNGDGDLNFPAGVAFSAIAGGWDYGIGLDSGGNAWGFGVDAGHQLGTGGTGAGPVAMPAGVTFKSISVSHRGDGAGFTLALTPAGQAYAWGYNGDGELGDGTTTTRSTPVALTMPAGVTFSAVSAGGYHSLALDTTGKVWSWGANGHGQLGDGTTAPHLTPQPVGQPAAVTFGSIGAGTFHSVAAAATSGAASNASFPSPWAGAPGVTFVGGPGPYDTGALKLTNTTASPIPLDGVTVDIGTHHYDPWAGSALTVPAGGSLILAAPAGKDFDTSDALITGTAPPTSFIATRFATGFPNSGGEGPLGVAVDAQGNLYASASNFGQLYRFGPSGGSASSNLLSTPLGSSNRLGALAFTPAGRLYATVINTSRVLKKSV